MALRIKENALFNALEAIFEYADANLDPKGINLLTVQKEIFMIQCIGMCAEFQLFLSLPSSAKAAQYRAMGCPIHLIPAHVPGIPEFYFQEPDQPALTKSGWIKAQTIGLLIDGDRTYRFILGCMTSFNILIKIPNSFIDGGSRYTTLPDQQTLNQYAILLATAIGIQAQGLKERLREKLMTILAQQTTQTAYNLIPRESRRSIIGSTGRRMIQQQQYPLEQRNGLRKVAENLSSDINEVQYQARSNNVGQHELELSYKGQDNPESGNGGQDMLEPYIWYGLV